MENGADKIGLAILVDLLNPASIQEGFPGMDRMAHARMHPNRDQMNHPTNRQCHLGARAVGAALLLLCGALGGTLCAAATGAAISPLRQELGSAMVVGDANGFSVSTGEVRRTWRWTGHGLATTAFDDLKGGRESAPRVPVVACDWDLPGAITDASHAEWVSLVAHAGDDDGFSNRHLEVISTVRYPEARLEVQHVVWVFPDAPGVRTQLRVKALPGFSAKGLPAGETLGKEYGATFLRPSARSEHLPLDLTLHNERLYWGYYNDPGNRHDQSRDMLREQPVRGWPLFQREDIDWASGMAVCYPDRGVIIMKESPKCVNQPGHNTGAFYTGPAGVSVTGWGLTPDELLTERYREAWATWTIAYRGGADEREWALKRFDAIRYPVFPARDLFILANTWGPADPYGEQFTEEDHLLREIPALADLGVDVLQIDGGWQRVKGGPEAADFRPRYAQGWKTLKAAADRSGVRLGLWVAIRNARVSDLMDNLDQLGFVTWKADFEHLANRGDYEQRIGSLRRVMKHAWGRTQFTLCPEYDDPRYGWYYAREYGSIYFQNVQEGLPPHLTMVPYQVLRQHWLMARYFPANKLQVLLQNPERTRADLSDAPQHGHAYCFAMGLPFVPCFFQSAQFLSPGGRAELKPLIRVYKQHRERMFSTLTFPIGDLPDNGSWSGFQMIEPAADRGYLLLFRERHNTHPGQTLRLRFLAGKSIVLEDLLSGGTRSLEVSPSGEGTFSIPQAPGFAFLRYEVGVSAASARPEAASRSQP